MVAFVIRRLLPATLVMLVPAITLALFQMTLIMRLVRSEILEVLRTDYIRFARARGQSVLAADLPIRAAYPCLIAPISVLINLLVDPLYFVVHTRLRVDGISGAH